MKIDKALRLIEKRMHDELIRQLKIVYGSALIALWMYFDYRELRLQRILAIAQATWEECSKSNDISMMQMLDEETGIELKLPNSDRSWRELAYLNASLQVKGGMDGNRWLYMRNQQIKWVGAQIMASLLLTMHRKEGFGYERLVRVMNTSDEVAAEYNYDAEAIRAAALELTGIDIMQTYDELGEKKAGEDGQMTIFDMEGERKDE